MATGYYSLIQYCPDPERAETINVGVLLFCPELGYLDAKVSRGNRRVPRALRGPEFDGARLNAIKRGIKKRLHEDRDRFQTPRDLEQFIATRANTIRLTEPRFASVDAEPSSELAELFEQLVGGPEYVRRGERQPVIPELDAAFSEPRFAGRIRRHVSVNVPVANFPIVADYAYHNGALNLIKSHVFTAHEVASVRSAMTLTAEGRYLEADAPSPTRLIVVGRFAPSLDDARECIVNVFERDSVRLVADTELPAFVEEVAREAHEVPRGQA